MVGAILIYALLFFVIFILPYYCFKRRQRPYEQLSNNELSQDSELSGNKVSLINLCSIFLLAVLIFVPAIFFILQDQSRHPFGGSFAAWILIPLGMAISVCSIILFVFNVWFIRKRDLGFWPGMRCGTVMAAIFAGLIWILFYAWVHGIFR